MTIVCRVAADFTDTRGHIIYSVPAHKINTVLTDVPEEIRQDPLFNLLIQDGSLDAVVSADQLRALENDPAAGSNAEGKRPGGSRRARKAESGAASPEGTEAAGGDS